MNEILEEALRRLLLQRLDDVIGDNNVKLFSTNISGEPADRLNRETHELEAMREALRALRFNKETQVTIHYRLFDDSWSRDLLCTISELVQSIQALKLQGAQIEFVEVYGGKEA